MSVASTCFHLHKQGTSDHSNLSPPSKAFWASQVMFHRHLISIPGSVLMMPSSRDSLHCLRDNAGCPGHGCPRVLPGLLTWKRPSWDTFTWALRYPHSCRAPCGNSCFCFSQIPSLWKDSERTSKSPKGWDCSIWELISEADMILFSAFNTPYSSPALPPHICFNISE